MKNCLLFLAVVAVMMVGAPAYSQYVFLDVNGDMMNSNTDVLLPDDVLNSGVTSVDVYFVTDKRRDGSDAVCAQGNDLFEIATYGFVLRATGSGVVSYGTWTDNMGFDVKLSACGLEPYCTAGPEIWVSWGSGIIQGPGKYKVGTLAITVTGTPQLEILPGSLALHAASRTVFGSRCAGVQFDNNIRYGPDPQLHDFNEADGTEATTDVLPKTWGQIKELYR